MKHQFSNTSGFFRYHSSRQEEVKSSGDSASAKPYKNIEKDGSDIPISSSSGNGKQESVVTPTPCEADEKDASKPTSNSSTKWDDSVEKDASKARQKWSSS
ncbi:hypothetical protein Leryth_023224 [Lithospermum erythrorhizon]|nr:hypothetical protein Leryth_023224 [Lithospermum erythrorhizon]